MRQARAGAALAILLLGTLLAHPAGAQTPAAIISTPLSAGWNNISYLGQTTSVARATAPAAASIVSVWEFDALGQVWRGYDAQASAVSDLQQLTFGRAIWLLMTAPGSLQMLQTEVPIAPTLYSGMNNIAYTGPETPLSDALAPAAGRVRGVWRWDALKQRWQGATPELPAASEFTTLAPGSAYVIQLAPGGSVALAGPLARAVTPVPSASGQPAASPSPTPRVCFAFQAQQPSLAELNSVFNRAAFGLLTTDPGFTLPLLETDARGSGGLTAPAIPPTLLKAIAWTESSWRQAGYDVARGSRGRALTSSACAFGVMQVLSGMAIAESPTERQRRIGEDYLANIAAGTALLAEKWNLAPEQLPVVGDRAPRVLESWYYAVWAYHCFGARCVDFDLHDNPDDPSLTWPRPGYNSPEQQAGGSRYTRADYPYQEIVYGFIQNPPRTETGPLWPPLPVQLPPHGTVGFPTPTTITTTGATTDPTRPTDP